MTGSHLYDKNPFNLSQEAIEEGYFPTQVKPSKGLRLVYLPKDDRDLEFATTNIKLEPTGTGSIYDFKPNDFLPHADA